MHVTVSLFNIFINSPPMLAFPSFHFIRVKISSSSISRFWFTAYQFFFTIQCTFHIRQKYLKFVCHNCHSVFVQISLNTFVMTVTDLFCFVWSTYSPADRRICSSNSSFVFWPKINKRRMGSSFKGC